jgi:hypothetical protein
VSCRRDTSSGTARGERARELASQFVSERVRVSAKGSEYNALSGNTASGREERKMLARREGHKHMSSIFTQYTHARTVI